jgi:hypothetical protein
MPTSQAEFARGAIDHLKVGRGMGDLSLVVWASSWLTKNLPDQDPQSNCVVVLADLWRA